MKMLFLTSNKLLMWLQQTTPTKSEIILNSSLIDFKVQQRDGTNFAIGANVNDDNFVVANRAQMTAYEGDQMGIVNGANSFISRLSV